MKKILSIIVHLCTVLLMICCADSQSAKLSEVVLDEDLSVTSTAADSLQQVEVQDILPQGNLFVVISKQDMTLSLYDNHSKLISRYPIACGKGIGNKRKEGDMKTPEGVFSVEKIHDATSWTHDFKDGKGKIKGAYGSHFIRLVTPGHKGIGIHGTHDPESIGHRLTEGCIRLRNQDLLKFVKFVHVGMPIIITTSNIDVLADSENESSKLILTSQ